MLVILAYLGGSTSSHKSLNGGALFLAVVKDTDVMMEEGSEKCEIMVLKKEEGGCELRNVGILKKLENTRKYILF